MIQNSNPTGNPIITKSNSAQRGTKSAGDEFGAFRDLTGKLVKVSKEDLDERRAKR